VHASVVVIDHCVQCGKATIVVETTFHVGEQSSQRCGAMFHVRGAVCLKAVDAYVGRGVQIPARIGPQRLHSRSTWAGSRLRAQKRAEAESHRKRAFEYVTPSVVCMVLKALPSRINSASNFPGPQLMSTFLTSSCVTPGCVTLSRFTNGLRSGASETIASTFKSRLGHPSKRCPTQPVFGFGTIARRTMQATNYRPWNGRGRTECPPIAESRMN